MKELYEVGIVFRGFILVKHTLKNIPDKESYQEKNKDLRGAFISAINSFAKNAFNDLSLEYLESRNFLFVFKAEEVKAFDSCLKEPVILYGLIEKSKKDPDKLVKKFLSKARKLLNAFVEYYEDKDFTELDQFGTFTSEITKLFAE